MYLLSQESCMAQEVHSSSQAVESHDSVQYHCCAVLHYWRGVHMRAAAKV
jgi:hypothetical protein